MTIFKSHWPSIQPLPDTTIVEFFISNPWNVPQDRTIVFDGTTPDSSRSFTYKEYVDDMVATGSGIRHLLPDVQPGDLVSVLTPNTIQLPSFALGITSSGAIPCMTSSAATPSELAHAFSLVEPAGPKVIFVHPTLIANASEAISLCKGFTRTPKLVSMLEEGNEGLMTIQAILKAGRENPLAPLPAATSSKLAMIYYSSGTTGKFKAVELSHGNLIANALQLTTTNPEIFGEKAVLASFLPISHSYGLCIQTIGCALSGTPTVHMAGFDLPLYLSVVQKFKVTTSPIVPPVALALAKHPLVDKYDTSSLECLTISAAPTKRELADALRKRLKVKVVQGYGMTEASPATHQLLGSQENQHGSVGRLLPDMEAKIIGEDGKELGIDQEGELVLRGPNVMLGYRNNPEATAEAIRDGWLHTGDIARRNADGFYWIVDRKKELIKVRGFQVAPADLEGLLISCPLVLDCAVVATYDDSKATEFPRAFVVVEPSNRTPAKAREIQHYVDSKVAHYKRLLGGVFFLDEIPKNASGKILRRLLPKEPGAIRGKL
ncbi:hypothetical protein MNV49_003355 [Pseudohyphozyma bogoriensis]|nr:hypothetical protein MNV49_003355 [Pseudohyphozyma bogoriensis]